MTTPDTHDDILSKMLAICPAPWRIGMERDRKKGRDHHVIFAANGKKVWMTKTLMEIIVAEVNRLGHSAEDAR